MNRKQKVLRLIAVCLSVIIMLSCIAGVSAANKEAPADELPIDELSVDGTSFDEPSYEELAAAQARAVAADGALMWYFLENGWVLEYPEYFSSRYIEDNILHIRLVSPTDQEMDTLRKVLSGYEDVILYEYGQYSQKDLQAYADAAAMELEEQGCAVTYWYVDSTTGSIVIGVLPEDIDLAKALIENEQASPSGGEKPEIIIEKGGYAVLD